MQRRRLLAAATVAAAGGCAGLPLIELRNPCLAARLPETLAGSEFLRAALEGLHPDRLWDAHVHLVGAGESQGGAWISPDMLSPSNPVRYAQYRFYLNAACVDDGDIGTSYLARLAPLQDALPAGAKAMLLAFDYAHDETGRRREDLSTFHVPDAYAEAVAAAHPDRFEWVASVHPCREDAAEAVQRAAAGRARAVKWLPPAMNIDPASPRCDAFYEALRAVRLPLLVHCGDERAVRAARPELGNPLRLRRALEHGVTVIVAHCASLGAGADLDLGPDGPERSNLELFARLMDEPRWEGRLFGEVSALTQRNRLVPALDFVVSRSDWQGRLVNGSDYPLPAVLPLYSLREMVARGYLDQGAAEYAAAVRRHNALLFDLLVKRLLRVRGQAFAASVFETRRLFDPGSA